MEGIHHSSVNVNGLNIHVAEKGEGPAILFIHGFPELWYSWRHQILSLASLGYRAIAPDLRGFGETEAPASVNSYTCFHIVGDLVELLDAVAADEEKVFVVGHDWGAIIAWFLCLLRPDRVKALVNMSVVFNPITARKPVDSLRAFYGDEYYIARFQNPGEIEAEFASLGTERVLKEFFTYRTPGPILLPKGRAFARPDDTPITLPSWLSEQDIDYFVGKFDKTGFTGGVNYYRNINRNWELMTPWIGCKIKVPVKFITGDQDLCYHMPGVMEYIHGGGFKNAVPLLDEVIIMEGVAHFINQEKPDDISKHIYDFIKKF